MNSLQFAFARPLQPSFGMNALELLKADHDKVRELFAQFHDSNSDNKRRQIFRTIRNELETHSFGEEMAFYPALSRLPDLRETIEQSSLEHQSLRALITKIDQATIRPPYLGFSGLVEELEVLFERHVSFEENEIFPRAKRQIEILQLEALAVKIQQAKQEMEESAA